MAIIKPYTFVAGNKARANEVNADFDILYQQVNANITDIAENASDIESLDSSKADINGSSTQRFAVADPVSSGDAVNKQTLFRQIGNSIDYIGGLTIEKDSGSPNDTILVNPGAAYDSTRTVVLSLANITSKKNATQAANATYYVYIIGNSTGSSIDILISTESITPTLPSGYTLYRRIGYYTTNSSGNIDIIYGNNNIAPIVKSHINGNSGYIIYSNGLCDQWGRTTAASVSFLQPYVNTNYCVLGQDNSSAAGTTSNAQVFYNLTKNGFSVASFSNPISWRAIGYIH